MLQSKVLLVTGTDTGVGKTFVAAGLACTLNALGISTIACKPAETGCSSDAVAHEDGVMLWEASQRRGPRGALYRLREPLAPAVAADHEHIKIDVDHIIAHIRGLQSVCQQVIVEGAGGILVPLTWEVSYLDLATRLAADVLLVGRVGLGTINHTLLTCQALSSRQLRLVGIILNQTAPTIDPSVETNVMAIQRLSGCERICRLPFLSVIDSTEELIQRSSTLLSEVVDWIS